MSVTAPGRPGTRRRPATPAARSVATSDLGEGGSRPVALRLLSLAALVTLVVVVPIALLRLGGSPFEHWSLAQARHVLGIHERPDAPLVSQWLERSALLVAWLTWAWMTACIALELRSWRTGRGAARLPGSRTMQSVAACLVGTALALSAPGRSYGSPGVTVTARPTQGFALGGVLRVIDDAPVHSAGPSPTPVALARRRPPGPRSEVSRTTSAAATVHLVGPRETLWSVAALRLGSALRWREIAALNYGRPQSDGGALTTRHWIEPGWTLLLPDGESVAGSPPGGDGHPATGSVRATHHRSPRSVRLRSPRSAGAS